MLRNWLLWVIAPSGALTVLTIAALSIYSTAEDTSNLTAITLFLIAGPSLVCLMLAQGFYRERRNYISYRAALSTAPRSVKRFVLVLRSFQNRAFHERNYTVIDPASAGITHHHESLTTPIQSCCAELGLEMVVIGGDLAAVGDSSHPPIYLDYVGDEWRDAFQRLAGSATAIIVFPEDSQALKEEIMFLAGGNLLAKTLFLAPPALESRWTIVETQKQEVSDRWENLKAAFREWGVDLPDQTRDGFLFRLSRTCERSLARQINLLDPSLKTTWSEQLLTALRGAAQTGGALGPAIRAIPTQSRISPFSPLQTPGGGFFFAGALLAAAATAMSLTMLILVLLGLRALEYFA